MLFSEESLLVTHIFDEAGASEHIFKLESGALVFFVVISNEEENADYELYYATMYKECLDYMHELVKGWFDMESLELV